YPSRLRRDDGEQNRYAEARRQYSKLIEQRSGRNGIIIAQPQTGGHAGLPPAVQLVAQGLPLHRTTLSFRIASSFVAAEASDRSPFTNFRAAADMIFRSASLSRSRRIAFA